MKIEIDKEELLSLLEKTAVVDPVSYVPIIEYLRDKLKKSNPQPGEWWEDCYKEQHYILCIVPEEIECPNSSRLMIVTKSGYYSARKMDGTSYIGGYTSPNDLIRRVK
jgi:hypothetical protein